MRGRRESANQRLRPAKERRTGKSPDLSSKETESLHLLDLLGRQPSSRLFGVVIVHYDRPADTMAILEAMQGWPEKPSKVVLADNSAPRHDWHRASDFNLPLEIQTHPDNPGYAAAVNRSLDTFGAGINFLLVLTHEVEIEGNVVSGLLDVFFQNQSVAISAPAIAYKSNPGLYFSTGGKLSKRGRATHTGINTSVAVDTIPHRGTAEVDWADGSCQLIRLDLLRQLGGLDESFFLYVEEVDLCLRARLAGGKIMVSSHLLALQEPGKFKDFLRYRNHILLTWKHRGVLDPWPWAIELLRDLVRWMLRRRNFSLIGAVKGIRAGMGSAEFHVT